MTAGAVAVPTIVPLRAPAAGQSKTVIDSDTKLELRSETPGAVMYYTLNGEKPAPFQTIGPAAKATLMYQEPFALQGGKHTIKAVAVSEDGRESHIVTKKFEVKQTETVANVQNDDNVDFSRTVAVSERSKKELEKFGVKTMSLTGGIQGSKHRSDSAREGSSSSRRQFAPRFMNAPHSGTSDRSTNGHFADMRHVNGTDGRPSHWKVPNDDSSIRLQRETDFLKCTNCFAPRPTDPFARFCNECGGAIPPLPQSRIPPPAAGQVGPCINCKGIVPLNAPNCLVCEAPLRPQNVPQASLRLADKLLCIVCGTANPPNITSCVMCAASLLTDSKVTQPAVEGTTMASARGALKQTFVQCTKCGRTNAAEARFCDWCGTKVTTVNAAS